MPGALTLGGGAPIHNEKRGAGSDEKPPIGKSIFTAFETQLTPDRRTRSHHTFRPVRRRARPPPTGDTAESSAEKGEVPVISPITGTRAATEGRSDAISITGGDVRTTGGDDTFDETFDET